MALVRIGIDIGSTTVKAVVLDAADTIVFCQYQRHFSDVARAASDLLLALAGHVEAEQCQVAFTGSAGMGAAEHLHLPFVQEVIAGTKAVRRFLPQTDTVVELGGEDAKITYLTGAVEQRMNGVCAGGTGAFIDQMACLLNTDAQGLNDLAQQSTNIYPIASRCGVFAKTDVQALMNDGVSPQNIAASILQAVVNQTISSLAQGRPIRGTVAMLGGPLHFFPELRRRFAETLQLAEDKVLHPDKAQYFVALGAALLADGSPLPVKQLSAYAQDLARLNHKCGSEHSLAPLFAGTQEREEFLRRHAAHRVPRASLKEYKGAAYLGIDAGSTTTKLALIDDRGALLHTHYGSNQGQPLQTVVKALQELYTQLPEGVHIANTAVVGYGEGLIQAALRADIGEVETVAHLKAARFFQPDVTFVLDIGGQDMKSFTVRDGVITSIMLNEACSSGCGSFIETFARSLGLSAAEFAEKALSAEHPVDLGTRCTVFMNSKVKQAQKEGVSVGELSAGLAVSVIKNALFKVIRLKNVDELGEHIVVQGGTFHNLAVLRAIEVILGRDVVCPDVAGLMGAYGAALIAKERCADPNRCSSLASAENLTDFQAETSWQRCGRCGNNCLLTVQRFSGGSEHITGNRCERGANKEQSGSRLPNMYAYKYRRVFAYKALGSEAKRGTIGLPRALNMFEDYPFWFTLFTKLGYRVVLSGHSSAKLFASGMDTIPSETICYPAQLVHGHIADLLARGVTKIFYPSLPFNCGGKCAKEHFNCPVVASYPESIAANMECLQNKQVRFYHPFVSLKDPDSLAKRLYEELAEEKLSLKELRAAVKEACAEQERYRGDVRRKAREVLSDLCAKGQRAVVLLGRPYHIDPEVNHGLPQLIQSFGWAVLSEDSLEHLAEQPALRVIDQWEYHARLYRAAYYTAAHGELPLEIVQLNSFGCGLDAVTIDQVKEILDRCNRLHTVIKLDSINNLGAARIRLRSLWAALQERRQDGAAAQPAASAPEFVASMRRDYTILAPQVAPWQFQFIQVALQKAGYRLVIPEYRSREVVDLGLKYVHNDVCFPAVLVVGQLLKALQSGEYDLDRTAILYFQSGGGCRASNYTAFLRKALDECSMKQVPIMSVFNHQSPGFSFTMPMVLDIIKGTIYGDLLMQCVLRMRPYELNPGSVQMCYDRWMALCQEDIRRGSYRTFVKNLRKIIADFDEIPIREELQKPKVGIVGEIMVKYMPFANNNLVDWLESEGAEVVVPGLLSFLQYCAYDSIVKHDLLSGSWLGKMGSQLFLKLVQYMTKEVRSALQNSRHFAPMETIQELAENAKKHISLGNMNGEGWLITAETVAMVKRGILNIVNVQPFGCLPNHVVARGMMKKLRQSYPGANLCAIDYDSALSEVNQHNRLKLMLAVAKEQL